jgi:hypothetical protein
VGRALVTACTSIEVRTGVPLVTDRPHELLPTPPPPLRGLPRWRQRPDEREDRKDLFDSRERGYLEPGRTARLGFFDGFVDHDTIALRREDARGLSLPPHSLQRLGERLTAEAVLPPRKLADGEIYLLLTGTWSTEGHTQDLHLCAAGTRTLRVVAYLARSRLRCRLGQRTLYSTALRLPL